MLDLAAGTGKLTRLLAARIVSVTAVEPLAGMRVVLEAQVPGVPALAGTAEAIPLADDSVDAVFVAEAIHWFDPGRAVPEIARVVRPGGGLAVLYNRHDWKAAGHPWGVAADDALGRHRLPLDDVDPHDVRRWRAALEVIPRRAGGRAALSNRGHDRSALTSSRRLSWSSRQAGQPVRCAAMPGMARSGS